MKNTQISTEKRGRFVALMGLGLQLLLTLGYFLLSMQNGSASTAILTWYSAGGILVWFALALIYHQRSRVALERLEADSLRSARAEAASQALFEADDEDYLVARRRLRWMQRWVLSAIVLTVCLLLGGGTAFFFWSLIERSAWNDAAWFAVGWVNPSVFCLLGAAFVSFLFSRYVSGMARNPAWQMLRAGSVFLFGNALFALALLATLSLVSSVTPIAERVLAQVGVVLVMLVACEILGNFILDFYRPRAPGEPFRPAFESRLLSLVSEPGDIARSIAEAVNYQFGFEVSTTWIYRTLQENVVRLAAVSVIVLIGMTSLVIVDANEMGIKERWGRPVDPEQPLGPGLYLKWPWPMEVVRKANIRLIDEIVIGEKGTEAHDDGDGGETVITWTEDHKFVASVDLLVATPELARLTERSEASRDATDVAVSIMRVSMPVQYRVRHDRLRDYLYNYREPDRLLRDIAYRELVKQAVHFDYRGIMAEQRGAVAQDLQDSIQASCDRLELGLEIVYVALQDIHPPTESDVAATFQKVATAEQQRNTLIQAAEIEYAIALIKVAGDVGRAEELARLVEEKSALSLGDRATIDAQLREAIMGDVANGVLPVRGDAGEALSRARADAVRAINEAAAKAATFDLELSAYRAAPELYKQRKLLQEISGELDDIRKYVVSVDPSTRVIFEIDESEAGGLELIDRADNN